jgi:hypothetical protein
MADAADTTNPSRRLFLAAGPAAVVFGALHAATRCAHAATVYGGPQAPSSPMPRLAVPADAGDWSHNSGGAHV